MAAGAQPLARHRRRRRGAAFGVFYSNIWEPADAFSTLELSLAELQDRFALAEGKATPERAGNRRAPPMSGPWPPGSNTAA